MKYTTPVLEIVAFNAAEVIVTSFLGIEDEFDIDVKKKTEV